MSDMTVGGNIPNTDLTAALTMLAQSIGCGDVQLSGTVNDGKVMLTMTDNKTGATSSRTFTPELDPAQFADNFDLAQAQSEVIRKVDEFKAALKSEEAEDLIDTAMSAGETGLVTEESTGYSKALFDIYSIIRLCKTTAQELKDTMRVAREADLQASISQTLAEADAQRHAAMVGLVVTVVVAGLSGILTAGFGGVGVCKSGSASKMRMGGQVSRKSQKLKTMMKGGNEELAAANRKAKHKKLTDDEQKAVEEYFGKENVDAPKNQAKTEEMDGMKEMTDEARLTKYQESQTKLEKQTDIAYDDLQKAKADNKGVKEKQKQYDSCLRKEQYGQSVLTHEKTKAGKTEALKDDVRSAQGELEQAAGANNRSAKIQSAEQMGHGFSVGSQTAMMLGNSLGGLGGSIQAMESAEATKIEADVKEADARREEDNEVFSAAQQLIDEALSLAKSVNESLAQTNQNILA